MPNTSDLTIVQHLQILRGFYGESSTGMVPPQVRTLVHDQNGIQNDQDNNSTRDEVATTMNVMSSRNIPG